MSGIATPCNGLAYKFPHIFDSRWNPHPHNIPTQAKLGACAFEGPEKAAYETLLEVSGLGQTSIFKIANLYVDPGSCIVLSPQKAATCWAGALRKTLVPDPHLRSKESAAATRSWPISKPRWRRWWIGPNAAMWILDTWLQNEFHNKSIRADPQKKTYKVMGREDFLGQDVGPPGEFWH